LAWALLGPAGARYNLVMFFGLERHEVAIGVDQR